jgi:hypothetical protein
MTDHPEEYTDQDAEPTMHAPDEDRPDATVAPERATDVPGNSSAEDAPDQGPGEHIETPE